jgi:hypothetical protein
MKRNSEEILDKVTAEIRNERIDTELESAAADRVWARISAATSDAKLQSSAVRVVDRIEGCSDFQSLIPAYIAGELSEARSLLLVDHTHECIPCRKAMNAARSGQNVVRKAPTKSKRYSLQPVVMRWGIAAALVIGIGLLALPMIQRYWPFGNFEATVQAAEGQVYQVADNKTASIASGAKLAKGEIIRTAKDARAVVKLGDGSSIEMKDRAEFYLTKNGNGTTIHLSRGSIVVEAAKQKGEQLFVDTGDSLVSVTGTVFSVNNGTKGSRVSVIQGEVNLNHSGNDQVLRAGEQATTSAAISKVAIKEEVAWSRKAAQYSQMLMALEAMKKELAAVPKPGVRNSTHLLDLMPANTVVYAGVPNLANTIVESHRVIQERMSQNPALREWWDKEQAGKHQNMDQVMATIREFGEYLGDEIAVSVAINNNTEPDAPVVLAELKNSNGLREFIEQQIAKYSNEQTDRASIQFVDDPATSTAITTEGEKKDHLYVWINDNLLAASPKLEQLQDVQKLVSGGAASTFTSTPFHDRIAQVYSEGAGLVVAANLEKIVEQTTAERSKGADAQKREDALNRLGILSVKYFVLDQKDFNGKTHTQASLSFNDATRGIPSWLAAPGPMGALEYISQDANVVAGFVVKDPKSLVGDLLGVLETVSPELRKNLDRQQSLHGLDIQNDIAAPLGGEFAFAIDGPILPTPSWKLVFEVNDPEHLQQTLERVVMEINKQAAVFGKSGLSWEKADGNDRTFYTLNSADFGVQVNYVYSRGYMIVAPSRALLERALGARDNGASLLHSSAFTAGLPADGNANFSAVFYHNLAPLLQPFAQQIANTAQSLPKGPQEAVKAMTADMKPTLAYAYAQGNSITFAANTEGGPFGLSPATLLGMPNALEMQNIIQHGMGK